MTFLDELVHISVKDFQMPNAVLVDFYYNHTKTSKKEFDEQGNEITISGYNAIGWRYKLKIPFPDNIINEINDKFGLQQIYEQPLISEGDLIDKTKIIINELPDNAKEFIKEYLKNKYIEILKEKGYNNVRSIKIQLPDNSLL